jgi:GTPase KRas
LPKWYRSADGFLILYNITDLYSFQQVEHRIEKIIRVKDLPKFPLVLIGTKCDLEDGRLVKFEDGMKMAQKFNIPFFETSAKVFIIIEESIFSLIEEMHKKTPIIPVKSKNECFLMCSFVNEDLK